MRRASARCAGRDQGELVSRGPWKIKARKKPLTMLEMGERVVERTKPIEYVPMGMNVKHHDVWVSQAEYDRCVALGMDVSHWTVVR